MRKIVTASLFLCILIVPITAYADKDFFSWDETNTKLFVPTALLLFVDYRQTLTIAKNCKRNNIGYRQYHENNFFLKECPSRNEVQDYFGAAPFVIAAITYILPPMPSYVFQGSTIGIEVFSVGGNIALGIGLKL
jgi:hypothetical protein